MKVERGGSPFGSYARTRALLTLHLMGESYAREMARLLDVSLSSVQGALRSLEVDGLITARSAGRTRLYRIDPRGFATKELELYLARLLEGEDLLRARVARRARRAP